MSKTTTFNSGMKLAQTGKPLPKMSGTSYQTRQDFASGYRHGQK